VAHHFFVERAAIEGDRATLRGEQARQITGVLRLQRGDRITLVSNGVEHDVVIARATPREVQGAVTARRPAANEPHIALTLALPLLRGERSEEIIEAATQLGVTRFVPFVSERSVVRALGLAKRARWERIARESAETARRGRVPAIDEVRTWDELVGALTSPVLIAWEGERERSLAEALPRGARELSVVVGPEGGLTSDEVALGRSRGATTVSLGRRNLRSETAATAAVAQVTATLDR
jgi:16S rRNA (uracil1498-N3)-methyltransferase